MASLSSKSFLMSKEDVCQQKNIILADLVGTSQCVVHALVNTCFDSGMQKSEVPKQYSQLRRLHRGITIHVQAMIEKKDHFHTLVEFEIVLSIMH